MNLRVTDMQTLVGFQLTPPEGSLRGQAGVRPPLGAEGKRNLPDLKGRKGGGGGLAEGPRRTASDSLRPELGGARLAQGRRDAAHFRHQLLPCLSLPLDCKVATCPDSPVPAPRS